MGAIKVTFVFDDQHYDVVAKTAVALELECAVGFADETIRRLSEGSFEFALRDPRTDNKIELIGELARCERADDGGRVVRIWIGKNERNRSRRVRQDAGSGIKDASPGIEDAGPGTEDAGSGIGEGNESRPNQPDAGPGIEDASSGIPDAGSGIDERNESRPNQQDAGLGMGEGNGSQPIRPDAGPGIEDAISGIGERDEDPNSLDVGRMRFAKMIAVGGGKEGVGKMDADSGIPDVGSGMGEGNGSQPIRPDAGPGIEDAGSGKQDASSGVEDAGSGKQDASPGIEDAGSGKQDAGSGIEDANPGIEDAGPGIEDASSGKQDAGSGVQDANSGMQDAGSGVQDAGSGVEDASSGVQDAGSGIGEGDEDTGSLDVGRMKAAKTIAVGGGKGGVGKTIIAVNLALALSRMQKNVTLLDGDISNCNCNTLLGITKVDSSLEEYLREERSLDEITVSTAYPGLRLVCGAQNKVGASLTAEMPRLLNDIRQVDADCLVIDLGAGVNDETLDLYRLADEKIIIVTPQVTSLQNAYGFIKSAFFHDLKRSGGLAAFLDQAGSDPKKLHALIGSLEDGHTARQAFAGVLARQRFKIVGNMMNDDKDLKIIQNLQKVVGQYLHIDNTVLGTLATSEDIGKSVNRVTPFLVLSPDSPQSREMKRMAERLTQRTAGMAI